MTTQRKKVVFVVETKFQERDFKRYGVEILESNGMEVEIWDCSAILHPEYAKEYTPPDQHRSERLRTLSSYEGLRSLGSALTENDVVMQPRCRGKKYHQLQQAYLSGKARFGQFDFGLQPGHNTLWDKSPLARTFERVSSFLKSPAEIPEKIYNKIPMKLRGKGLRDLDFLILGGGSSIQNRNHEVNQAKTDWVWTHTLDYDLYLDLKKNGLDAVKEEHIVYLDSYLPYHPTWKITGEPAPVTPEGFYPRLRELFERLEQKLGIPVVIAAHPRSKYHEMEMDPFGGRELRFGSTIEQVRDAKLSIGHFSTSNSFNVLFEKPVICVTTNELEQSRFNGYVPSMAEMLGSTAVNLDEPLRDLEAYLKINDEAYQQFRTKFIKKPGTPEVSSWQIVSDYLSTKSVV